MGQVVNGVWQDADTTIQNGAYERAQSIYKSHSLEPLNPFREPTRYHLIASETCPWSHRVRILRVLKGLQGVLPLYMPHGPRIEGISLNEGLPWSIPGTDQSIVHLHQLYSFADPNYSGRSTVPVLWDAKEKRVISNESANIMRILDEVSTEGHQSDVVFAPSSLIHRIDETNDWIYSGLNNAVYRAGFAECETIRQDAAIEILETLIKLDKRLSKRRFLLGKILTESDLRLFPSLARFDAVYAPLFVGLDYRLTDYPSLWAYARDLYSIPGIASSIDFLKNWLSSAESDVVSVSVPTPPTFPDWTIPHGRELLSEARLMLRSGEHISLQGFCEEFPATSI